MTIIYLIRHGESLKHPALGYTIDKLTDAGRHVMHNQAHTLRAKSIARVISAPAKRSVVSARCMASILKIGIDIESDLREISRGIYNQLPYSKFLDNWAKYGFNYDYIPPNGESITHARKRITQGIQKIISRFPNQGVICVSHAGVIANLLMMLCEFDFESAKPECAEINVLRHKNRVFCLERTNSSIGNICVPESKLFDFYNQ